MKKKLLIKTFRILSIVLSIAITLFFLVIFIPFSVIKFPDKDYNLVLIEKINIVDVENDTILSDYNILIEENKIKKLSSGSISVDNENLKIIDGRGKYVVPALWDMHAHLTKQSPYGAYQEYLINGIMHIRDMRGAYNENDPIASTPERINEWNNQVANYKLIGPKVHGITSFAIEGPHPMFKNSPDFFNCTNPEEARELVSYFKQQKIDLIKVYNNISRESFFTLMQQAKLAGIDVAGHKPVRVSTIEASNAGMKSLEHARFLLWDSFIGSEKLRNSSNPKLLDNTVLRQKMLSEHDTSLLNYNLKIMRKNRTWYCPTHLTRKADAFADDLEFRARYDSINPILKFLSFEDLDGALQEDTTTLGREVYKAFYRKGLDISKVASDKGVKILAGSDVPELPGSSLLEELQELATAGLSNYEVLRTATLYPAEYYNKKNEYGTIEENKIADLVIIANNPISNISNLENIEGIVYMGYFIDKTKIQAIQKQVYERNTSVFMSIKLIWDIIIFMKMTGYNNA